MPTALAATAATIVRRIEAPLAHEDARTMATQVQVAGIPSPTSREGPRARWMQRALEALGYRATMDEVGNVLATTDATLDAPPVVVCAHLDTVFSDEVRHHVTREGDRYVGPGIGDNARGLAGLLALARIIREHDVRTRHPVLLVATVGEEGEGDLRGARHLFAGAAARACAAFALDGAGDERIVTHAVGTRRFQVTFRGPGGHSWAAGDTPNPVHAAADLAARVARMPRPTTPRTTIAVTRLHGGDAVNAIPTGATADVELRSLGAGPLATAEVELHRLLAAVLDLENARDPGGTRAVVAQVTVTSDRPGGVVCADALPVRATIAATEAIDRAPEFASASTDVNIPLSLGIPAVAIGAGGAGGDTHTTHEWFENRAGPRGLARAVAAVLATAGLA